MRYGVLALALLLVVLAGCFAGTKAAGPADGLDQGPEITAAGFLNRFLYEGTYEPFSVRWQYGTAPFTISINTGGGTANALQTGTAESSPFEHYFVLLPGSWEYAVTVTDANGLTAAATGSYSVVEGCDFITIDDVSYAEGVLTVTVSDPDLDDITVTVTEPEGLEVDAISKVIAGSGTADFYWSAIDYIAGAVGTTDITADNGHGATDNAAATIAISPIKLPDGVLAAVPAARNATTADVVTVAVIAGDFSSPFQNMNGAGVTVEDGATYAGGTFNVGAPGGKMYGVDGIWTNIGADAILRPGEFWVPTDPIGAGRVRMDFNVTPVGGSETSDGGVLFNFGLAFDHAGTYTLGFEEFHDVKRTYYSDGANSEYFWDDISNNYPGVPNSIEVREP